MTNPMRRIQVEKVTLNIGAGKETERLDKAVKLLSVITGRKPVKNITKKRIPTWGVRPGLPLGVKVTLRKEAALDVLRRALEAKEKKLNASSFGARGEVAFGVPEYIDIPGAKYDPEIGIIGLDVCITLSRPGFRIRRRQDLQKSITKRHAITRDEAISFMQEAFGVEVVS